MFGAIMRADGARGGIIDALEMVDSDFAANPVKVKTQEADVSAEYEKIIQENKVTNMLKVTTEEADALGEAIAALDA